MKAARNVTNGGRALNAIWECQGVTSSQAFILMFLGSQLDFREEFTEFRWCSVERIARATKLSQRQVFYHLKDLIAHGYLKKQQRFQDGRQLPSAYAITDKIFDEYEAILRKKEADMGKNRPATIAGGDCNHCSPGGATIADRAPSVELIQLAPSISRDGVPGENPTDQKAKEPDSAGRTAKKKMGANPSREARTICEEITSFQSFVPIGALHAEADRLCSQFGIETLRGLRADLIAEGLLGRVPWRQLKKAVEQYQERRRMSN